MSGQEPKPAFFASCQSHLLPEPIVGRCSLCIVMNQVTRRRYGGCRIETCDQPDTAEVLESRTRQAGLNRTPVYTAHAARSLRPPTLLVCVPLQTARRAKEERWRSAFIQRIRQGRNAGEEIREKGRVGGLMGHEKAVAILHEIEMEQ